MPRKRPWYRSVAFPQARHSTEVVMHGRMIAGHVAAQLQGRGLLIAVTGAVRRVRSVTQGRSVSIAPCDYTCRVDIISIVLCDYTCRVDIISIVLCDYTCRVDIISIVLCDYTCSVEIISIVLCDYTCSVDIISIVLCD